MSAFAGKRLLEAHDASSGRNRRRCDNSGVCRNSRAARAGPCADLSRPHARLRMSPRAARSPVSCVDPCRQPRGFDAGAGPDAVLAFFISRVGCGLGGGASAVFQGCAGAPPAPSFRGADMTVYIDPMVGRHIHVEIDREMHRVYPLYLLTGEYDFSCTPEDTMRTAAAIGGARVTIMERLRAF